MLPLRPKAFPRYRRYICPSCTAKLQSPPWLIRNASTRTSQNERPKAIHQQKPKKDVQLDEDLMSRLFEQMNGGGLRPEEEGTNENDIEALRSRIEALETDLKQLKAGEFPQKDDDMDLISFLEKFPEDIPTLQNTSLGMPACRLFFGDHTCHSRLYS
jgi:hypothetical protein